MSHDETVRAEFTRQAEAFRASPTLRADAVTGRIGDALGPSASRVLDVACGPGVLLPTLAARAPFAVGVDLTPRNLELAREHGAAHLVRGHVERLPFAPESFDAVVLRLALHHFVDPGAAIDAARALLRPGGRLIVLDVLAPEDAGKRALRDAIERLRDPSHTALLAGSQLQREIERAGLRARAPVLWSQAREFSEWARIINEPRRMADLELVLRALLALDADPTGLKLREREAALWFTYDWGLFVGERV